MTEGSQFSASYTGLTVPPSLTMLNFSLSTTWTLLPTTAYGIVALTNVSLYSYAIGTGSGAGTPVLDAGWSNLGVFYQSKPVVGMRGPC